ncbi:hypothetical protein NOGI109294_11675 [Nocardiopsis gilva]
MASAHGGMRPDAIGGEVVVQRDRVPLVDLLQPVGRCVHADEHGRAGTDVPAAGLVTDVAHNTVGDLQLGDALGVPGGAFARVLTPVGGEGADAVVGNLVAVQPVDP